MIFYESKSNYLTCWSGSDMTFPPHIHKELELLILTQGEIELTINATTQTLKKGDIGIVFPNTIHAYKTINHCDYLITIFNGDMLPLYKNTFFSYKPSKNYLVGSNIPSDVYKYLSCIHSETQLNNNIGMVTGYLYLVIGTLLPLLNLQKSQKEASDDLIERILKHIQINYLNPINLTSISAELNISPFYISRVFSSNIGIRLDEYINELRINYANYLLSSTNMQVTEIAFECGFDTLRTFNRAYKKFTSITPREYRKQQN